MKPKPLAPSTKRPVAAQSGQRAASGMVGQVAAWLLDQIRQGAFRTGEQLPSERQLCAQFAVSRPVVREALSQLRSEGLILVQQGRGAFVAEGNQRQSFRLHSVSLSEKHGLAHVLELLMAVEVAATGLAAQRRTAEDLRKIRRGLVGMEYAIVNDQLGDKEDFAFHQAIVGATHNPHFQELSEHLEHAVRGFIRQARSNTAELSGDLVKAVQLEHRAIFDAIEKGDPQAAAEAAESHLRNAGVRLQTYLAGRRRKTQAKAVLADGPGRRRAAVA